MCQEPFRSSFTSSDDTNVINELLSHWRIGDLGARDELLRRLCPELMRIARRYHRRFGNISLNPSDIFNEFSLKLLKSAEEKIPSDRAHFAALASTIMRQVLIDHIRRRRRRPELVDFTVFQSILRKSGIPEDCSGLDLDEIQNLDEALTRLAELAPRQAKVVEHFYFGALTTEEISELMQIGRATVVRDLDKARALLKVFYSGTEDGNCG